jgi:hypothetical protein
MQQDLSDGLLWIIRSRPDYRSIFEKDLLDDATAREFERAGLPACSQELEQVRELRLEILMSSGGNCAARLAR